MDTIQQNGVAIQQNGVAVQQKACPPACNLRASSTRMQSACQAVSRAVCKTRAGVGAACKPHSPFGAGGEVRKDGRWRQTPLPREGNEVSLKSKFQTTAGLSPSW